MSERLMKDSRIDWVGDIPDGWLSIRNKNCFKISKTIVGKECDNTQLLSLTTKGVIEKNADEMSGKVPTTFATYQKVKPEQIVMCLFDLDCSAVFSGISKYNGMISPAYRLLSCKENILPRFADYWFSFVFVDRKYMQYSKNVRYSVGEDEFAPLPIIVPPLNEQKKIADYLDSKCSDIDALTKDIENEISTLEEYKKSVITGAITNGLNHDIKMKDSGIEWIGDIPSNWKLDKGKFIFEYELKPVKEDDGVITCFRDGEVTLRSNRRTDGFTESMKEIGYQGIDIGDLVVHGMDGFAGAIGISDSRGKASPVLNNLDTKFNKKYYMYLLRTYAWKGVFIALATGIRVRTCDTNWGKLRELLYIVPSKDEQDQIVKYLDDKCSEIDNIISEKKKQLDVLSEYKKSLIYEYVTGKKEVA